MRDTTGGEGDMDGGVASAPVRPRLLARLDRARSGGDVLIVAGAGFGKRTLVRHWAAANPDTAIRWLQPDSPVPDAAWQGVVIAPVGWRDAAQIVRDANRRWRLIALAEGPPDCDLSAEALDGRLQIMDAADLAMTPDEVEALFPHAGPAALSQILDWTGGWPVAVQALATRQTGERTAAGLTQTFESLSALVFEFCNNRVLALASAEARAQLIALSVLSEVTLPLANALAPDGQGQAAIETCVSLGLLCRIPEHHARWRNVHPLLARHGQNLGDAQAPGSVRALHAKAARASAACGDMQLAIMHARDCQDWPLLARTIVKAGGWRLTVTWRNQQSDRDWLHKCVDDLPEPLVADDIVLRLTRAMLRHFAGDVRQAMQDFEAVSSHRSAQDADMALQIGIVGQLTRMLEEKPLSDAELEQLRDTLLRVPTADPEASALLENALAIASAQRGEVAAAIRAGDRAKRLYARVGGNIPVLVTTLVQGRALAEAGKNRLARSYFAEAQDGFERTLGLHSDLARCARLLIGQLDFAANNLDAARHALADVLPWVQSQEPKFHAPAFLTIAQIKAVDEGLESAFGVIDQAIRFARQCHLERLELLARLCWLELLLCFNADDLASAQANRMSLDRLAAQQSDPLLGLQARNLHIRIAIASSKPDEAAKRMTGAGGDQDWANSPLARTRYHLNQAMIAQQLGQKEVALQGLQLALDLAAPEHLLREMIVCGGQIAPVLRQHQIHAGQTPGIGNHAEEGFVRAALKAIKTGQKASRGAVCGVEMTDKEHEIVALLAKGLSNKEIGRIVEISDNTVKWHLKNLFRRLSVSSRAELVSVYQISRERRSLAEVSRLI